MPVYLHEQAGSNRKHLYFEAVMGSELDYLKKKKVRTVMAL